MLKGKEKKVKTDVKTQADEGRIRLDNMEMLIEQLRLKGADEQQLKAWEEENQKAREQLDELEKQEPKAVG